MTAWCLLKIFHTEPLTREPRRPDEFVALRTSYCLAPDDWRQLDEFELQRRVEILIAEAYTKRHPRRIGRDELPRMRALNYEYEWIEPGEFGTRPWSEAVHSFRVDPTGDEWHILSWDDPDERMPPWDEPFVAN
jgi:hypothetical protein